MKASHRLQLIEWGRRRRVGVLAHVFVTCRRTRWTDLSCDLLSLIVRTGDRKGGERKWKKREKLGGKKNLSVKTKNLLCDLLKRWLSLTTSCFSRQRHRWRSEAFSTDWATERAEPSERSKTRRFPACFSASSSHVELQTLGNVSLSDRGQIVTGGCGGTAEREKAKTQRQVTCKHCCTADVEALTCWRCSYFTVSHLIDFNSRCKTIKL